KESPMSIAAPKSPAPGLRARLTLCGTLLLPLAAGCASEATPNENPVNPVATAAEELSAGAPTVTAVTPRVGPSTGRIPLHILGTNFANLAGFTVLFGSTPALFSSYVSTSDVIVYLPPRGSEARQPDITVLNPDGKKGTGKGLFTYDGTITFGLGTMQLIPA